MRPSRARVRRRSSSRLTRSQAERAGREQEAQVEVGAVAADRADAAERADAHGLAQPGQSLQVAGDGAQEGVEGGGIAPVPAAVAGADPDLAVEGEAEGVGDQAGGQHRQRHTDAFCHASGKDCGHDEFQAQPERKLLPVHAAHALQAPVRRQDEQAGLHQAGQHGRARPQRERLELGLAERGSHEHQFKPLVDRRVNFR